MLQQTSVNFRLADGNMPLKVLSTGVVEMDSGKVKVGTNGGEISGSGALKVGGAVTMEHLGSATVDVVNDLMIIDDGASGAIKTTSLSAYATALASTNNGGLASTGGKLELDLSDLLAGDFSHGSWYNSTFAFVDVNDSDTTKKESFADYATKIAGDGLAASNGVLAVGVDDTGIEINSDALRLKDSGVVTAKIADDAVTPAKMSLFDDSLAATDTHILIADGN